MAGDFLLAIFLNYLGNLACYMVRKHRSSDDKSHLKLWMSIFIAATMILSVFGIIIGSSGDTTTVRYNDFKFSQDPQYGFYTTKINGDTVPFYSLPTESVYFNLSDEVMVGLRSSVFIVTTFDPDLANTSLQHIELARFDLAQYMKGKQVYNAVLDSAAGYESLPILSCDNASATMPVVTFNISETRGIVSSGNCIYLNGKGADFLFFRDLILYKYLGVI